MTSSSMVATPALQHHYKPERLNTCDQRVHQAFIFYGRAQPRYGLYIAVFLLCLLKRQAKYRTMIGLQYSVHRYHSAMYLRAPVQAASE